MPRKGTTVGRRWRGVWVPGKVQGSPGGCRAPCIVLPMGHPQEMRWSRLGAVGGRETHTVSLTPREGEESCSPGFGSGLPPAGAELCSGPCAALPPVGTARVGGTATSLSLGIWPLILSGRDGRNVAILAQAFLINFSQAARCFWLAGPVVRDCLPHTFPGIWSGETG